MQHVLFLSYDGLTDPLGQSQILPYLKRLTKFQFRFTIISCEKTSNYTLHCSDVQLLLNHHAITWHPLKYHKTPPILSAIYDLEAMKRLAVKVYRKDPYVMVHTRCGTPAIVGNFLKNKLGIKFLHDLRDFYAQSKVDSGQWPQRNPLFRLVFRYFKRQEELQLKNSDGIVCLTHKAKDIILNYAHFNRHTPLAVIPCSVDLALFDPRKIKSCYQQKLRQKLGLKSDDVVFTYLGSIGTWYLTNEMFSLFKVILTKIENAKFLMISQDDPCKIKQIASRAGLGKDNVIVVKASRTEVPLYLSLSCFSIFFIKPCYSKQASSPTKFGEIMSMGIPVITNSGVGDVAEIITRYKNGILTDEFTSGAYEGLIEKIKSTAFDTKDIRRAAIELFDLDKAVDAYCALYRKIIPEKALAENHGWASAMINEA